MQAGYRAPKIANRSADAVRGSGRQHGQKRHRKSLFGSAGSETPSMHGNSMHGNQEVPVSPAALRKLRAGGKAADRGERNERTHGPGAGPDNNDRVKGA
jgi:hypothetical protein